MGARSGRARGSLPFGGGVGGIIDAHTDARRDCPGTIGVSCPRASGMMDGSDPFAGAKRGADER